MGDLNARLSGLSEVGYNLNFMLPTLGLIVLLIIFFILVKVVRKAKKGSSDIMAGITYLDVTGMKKQGLLTDEEMNRIRAAMSRQVERQRSGPAIKAPPSLAGELALMADPEVQELERLAEERLRSRGPERPATPPEPRSQPQSAPAVVERSASIPAVPSSVAENYGDPIPPDYSPLDVPVKASAELDASAWTRGGKSEPSPSKEVELPADVLKMAELGLITPEELERIKQRIRDKKSLYS